MHAVQQEKKKTTICRLSYMTTKTKTSKENKPYKIDMKLMCSDILYYSLSEGVYVGHSDMEKHKLCEILGFLLEYSECSSKVN